MKRTGLIALIASLAAANAMASGENYIVSTHLEDMPRGQVTRVVTANCDIDLSNASRSDLRQQVASNHLLRIGVGKQVLYGSSLAIFERDEGVCDMMIKDYLTE